MARRHAHVLRTRARSDAFDVMASSDHRCDLLLVHAHLLTLAPVLDDASDDEGVGYIEDVRRFAADPPLWLVLAGSTGTVLNPTTHL